MDAQLKKGLIEMCVLAIIAQEETYGYKIVTDISPYVEISETTLYPILRRLESSGYVSVSCSEHNGRTRKYYKITTKGSIRLGEYAEDVKEIKRILDFIVTGGKQ